MDVLDWGENDLYVLLQVSLNSSKALWESSACSDSAPDSDLMYPQQNGFHFQSLSLIPYTRAPSSLPAPHTGCRLIQLGLPCSSSLSSLLPLFCFLLCAMFLHSLRYTSFSGAIRSGLKNCFDYALPSVDLISSLWSERPLL